MSYPLEYIPNVKIPAVGGHPENIIMLRRGACMHGVYVYYTYHSGYIVYIATKSCISVILIYDRYGSGVYISYHMIIWVWYT